MKTQRVIAGVAVVILMCVVLSCISIGAKQGAFAADDEPSAQLERASKRDAYSLEESAQIYLCHLEKNSVAAYEFVYWGGIPDLAIVKYTSGNAPEVIAPLEGDLKKDFSKFFDREYIRSEDPQLPDGTANLGKHVVYVEVAGPGDFAIWNRDNSNRAEFSYRRVHENLSVNQIVE